MHRTNPRRVFQAEIEAHDQPRLPIDDQVDGRLANDGPYVLARHQVDVADGAVDFVVVPNSEAVFQDRSQLLAVVPLEVFVAEASP
ncbi:hypothetical protein D3C86_1401540 [compost metagenome]